MENIIERAKHIRLAVFDVDGVLTNGTLVYSANGSELKIFHVHDGQGLKFLQQTGIEIAIITARYSEIITQRMKDLDIKHVYQGNLDKLPAYEDLKQKLQLSDHQISYMGDDFPDLPILRRVGLAMTVANTPKIMQDTAHWIAKTTGGNGAVREACDLIMNAQGTYQGIVNSFLLR